jgi:hypothetical protein
LYQRCTVTKTSHLPIRYFLALLRAHPILHVSRIRVNVTLSGNCFFVSVYLYKLSLSTLRISLTSKWRPYRDLYHPFLSLLCSVYRASLYYLINKPKLVYNFFLVSLSSSTCFRRLWVHHQEKKLCFTTLDTSYSVWMTVWYAPCSLMLQQFLL